LADFLDDLISEGQELLDKSGKKANRARGVNQLRRTLAVEAEYRFVGFVACFQITHCLKCAHSESAFLGIFEETENERLQAKRQRRCETLPMLENQPKRREATTSTVNYCSWCSSVDSWSLSDSPAKLPVSSPSS
jgi:hypothetical protein